MVQNLVRVSMVKLGIPARAAALILFALIFVGMLVFAFMLWYVICKISEFWHIFFQVLTGTERDHLYKIG